MTTQAKFRYSFTSVLVMTVLTIMACSHNPAKNDLRNHSFKLVGGHFYGPGPIVPDTALPDGLLHNIKFDLRKFKGYAEFETDEGSIAFLSDGKTRINRNIEAGRLDIGGGETPVLLVAVSGGRNKGREYYQLDDDYKMVWTVDLALDPGFADGIIRVDDFQLSTGLVKIDISAQTEQSIPGGYDQAGTLSSGQYLAGRVGDFDQDGYMDGIVVAAPRVPLISNMLPGAPVGNQRGFETDVAIPPHLACELTLRGILLFREPLRDLIEKHADVKEITKLLKDIKLRIDAAQLNMDRAMFGGQWSPENMKQNGFLISDRLETVKILNFISISLTESYPTYGGKVSNSVRDAINKMFSQLDSLVDKVGQANAQTNAVLPKMKTKRVATEV